MTVAEIITAWMAFRQQLADRERIAPSTLRNQRHIASTLSAALGAIEVDGLRKSHLDLLVADRMQTCAPVTVHEDIAVLRQILNWAVDEQLLSQRPRMPTVSVANVERPLPNDEDYAWFLRTMRQSHAAALQFMLLTGLAPHELERLQARDHDAVTCEILIGQRADFAVKQESRRRRIPMNETARGLWWSACAGLAPTAHPFPKATALQKAMRRHATDRPDAPPAADGLTPKMMRKWFASTIAVDHSEAVLQRLLGHAPGSPITRRHYVRSTDSQLRDAVEGARLS